MEVRRVLFRSNTSARFPAAQGGISRIDLDEIFQPRPPSEIGISAPRESASLRTALTLTPHPGQPLVRVTWQGLGSPPAWAHPTGVLATISTTWRVPLTETLVPPYTASGGGRTGRATRGPPLPTRNDGDPQPRRLAPPLLSVFPRTLHLRKKFF